MKDKYNKKEIYTMNIIDRLIEILAQIWYLLPLFILLSFFKVYIEKKEKEFKKSKRKKNQREFHLKNEENGKEYERLTGKKFEELGYKVIYHGLEKGKFDQGIDLICYINNKIYLVQCKNYSKEKSITHEHIKIFHSNAIKYIKTHNLDEKNVELKYVIPNEYVLDMSAKKVLMNNFYNCEYLIVS